LPAHLHRDILRKTGATTISRWPQKTSTKAASSNCKGLKSLEANGALQAGRNREFRTNHPLAPIADGISVARKPLKTAGLWGDPASTKREQQQGITWGQNREFRFLEQGIFDSGERRTHRAQALSSRHASVQHAGERGLPSCSPCHDTIYTCFNILGTFRVRHDLALDPRYVDVAIRRRQNLRHFSRLWRQRIIVINQSIWRRIGRRS
jgi:hypothetical protein